MLGFFVRGKEYQIPRESACCNVQVRKQRFIQRLIKLLQTELAALDSLEHTYNGQAFVIRRCTIICSFIERCPPSSEMCECRIYLRGQILGPQKPGQTTPNNMTEELLSAWHQGLQFFDLFLRQFYIDDACNNPEGQQFDIFRRIKKPVFQIPNILQTLNI